MAPNELSIFGLNNVIYAGLNIVTVNTLSTDRSISKG